MEQCKHEAGLGDFVQVLEDKEFANISHCLYRCKHCGELIEKGIEIKDNKSYRVWKLAEIAEAAR